jgi:YHS domain-containing protein
MTDAAGSHTPKAGTIPSFGWAETPYLYVKLGMGGLTGYSSSFFWQIPQTGKQAAVISQSGNEYWFSPVEWNQGFKKTGTWNADINVFYAGGSLYGSKTFTVTPEPVSTALFLLGGAALAGKKYFFSNKAKKQAK